MFYQLYSGFRAFVVSELLDNNWLKTASFLHSFKRLNVVYAATSQGTLEERLERFGKLQGTLKEDDRKEEDKLALIQGLSVPDASSERNILCETVSDIVWNRNIFLNMFEDIAKTHCFVGPNKEACINYFMRALFAKDTEGSSVLLFAVRDTQFDSFLLTLNFMLRLGCFSKQYGPYFLELIKADNYAVFRDAAQRIDTYSFLQEVMFRSGFSREEWGLLLNRAFTDNILGIPGEYTPLMRLTYNTAARSDSDYKNFNTLISQLKVDGAQLTTKQIQAICTTLEELTADPICRNRPEHLVFLDEMRDTIRNFGVRERTSDRVYGAAASNSYHLALLTRPRGPKPSKPTPGFKAVELPPSIEEDSTSFDIV